MRSNAKSTSKVRYGRLGVEQLESRVVPAAFTTLGNDLNQALSGALSTVIGKFDQVQAALPIVGQSLATEKSSVQAAVSKFESDLNDAIGKLDNNSPATAADAVNALMATNDFKSLVPYGTYDPAHNTLGFTAAFQAMVPIDSTGFSFDLGLPGVPFSLTANLKVGVEIDYGYVTFKLNNGGFSLQSATNPAGQPNQLAVSLTAQAADLNLHGDIGFFQFTGGPVKVPQGQTPPPTIQLSAGVAMSADGATLSSAQLAGNAQVNLHLSATLASGNEHGFSFPHIETDFVMNWDLGTKLNTGSVLGSRDQLGKNEPTVAFNNVEFGLGSFLGSMVQPLANAVDQITAPLAPLYALMQAPLPGLSDLSEAAGGGAVSVDTLLSAAVAANVLPPDYQLLADLGIRLHDLVELIRKAQFNPDSDGLVPLGSFNLSHNGDLRDSTLGGGALSLLQWVENGANLDDALTDLVPHIVDVASNLETTIKNDIGSLPLGPIQSQVSQIFSQIDEDLRTAKNGIGLTFPLLDDPSSIYKLLLGQDVDFVHFHATFNGSASETKTIPVWGPVTAGFSGSIQFGSTLEAGVDTYGLRQFFISIINGNPDPGTLDQSFYVVSNGTPLVSIAGSITANVGPKLTFGAGVADIYAEATFNGGVQTNDPIQVNFVTANSPEKKLRPAILNGDLFTVSGSMSADFSFSVTVGANALFFGVSKTVFSLPIAQKTLFDTKASVSPANPFNQPPPPSSIDVVFNANFYGDAAGGNVLRVEVDNGNLTFVYNGAIRGPAIPLDEVNSITVLGSADEGTVFNVTGNFYFIPFRIEGGESSGDYLILDDTELSVGGSTYYAVHDTVIEREEYLPGLPVPILSTFNFQGIEGVTLLAPVNQSNEVHVYSLATPTVIFGGNAGNEFDLGGPGESLFSVLNLLTLLGGTGYDKLIVDDTANIGANTYFVGHNELSMSRTFKAIQVSGDFPLGSLHYTAPRKTLEYSGIDYVRVDAGVGGNTFTVDDVPAAGAVNPTAMAIALGTGSGADTVTLEATTGPVSVYGQGGNDVVNVGVSGRGTQDISGNVFVDNSAPALYSHGTTLNINDADDPTVRTVTFNTPIDGLGIVDGFTGTHTYPNPIDPSEGTTTIAYQIADVKSVNVQGSNSAFGFFNVLNTPQNLGGGILPKDLISTHLTLGSFFNDVNVAGTTGPLTITGGAGVNEVTLGALAGAAGDLGNLAGRVKVLGAIDQLTIKDDAVNAFRYYAMGATSFTGGATAGIFYPGLSLNGLVVDLGDGGNQLVVNGTPAMSGDGSGVFISTGNGSDAVSVKRTSAPLTLSMGNGAFQTVAIGSNSASLDDIGDVNVYAGGVTQAFVSDAAATTGQSFNISSVSADTEDVTRSVSVGDGGSETLNTFTFHFATPGQVDLTAGKGGDGVSVRGTPANTTTIITGGAGQDHVAIEADDSAPPVLGPLNFYGNASQGDYAYLYGENSFTPAQSYIFQATASKPYSQPNVLDQQRVLIGGNAPITMRGVATLTTLTASPGSFVSIQGVPAGESLDVFDAYHDRIIFGNALSSPIGYMADIRGTVSIIANGEDESVTLDDSIDSTGRHVYLEPATDSRGDVIAGMSPGNIYLALGATSTVNLIGGLGNDTFSMLGTGFGANFSVDGGKGTNALDYSGVTGLTTGVYVNLRTGEASGLVNGISRMQNVNGSALNDILVGNGGNVLDGGAGRDLLIAGATASVLRGGADEDLLIGGTTAYDTDAAELEAVLAAWAVDLDTDLLAGQVTSNGGGNTLLGQGGIDFFFVGIDDTNTTDRKKDETVVYV
ncbi:beta strand repeat-containing protein [Frigoriglobus tundricola]|uniref:Uncharacterized protein n=1 Tax=Frigoriglobus tundricola TaxID=2774151 RepID=A0A6M5YYS6_9BACT|nr:hypothetical protein [Frigoriglobus tundricola]QJW98401.1 hypothetical protein FTUN_5991 [Frigoriglobus tundricola]